MFVTSWNSFFFTKLQTQHMEVAHKRQRDSFCARWKPYEEVSISFNGCKISSTESRINEMSFKFNLSKFSSFPYDPCLYSDCIIIFECSLFTNDFRLSVRKEWGMQHFRYFALLLTSTPSPLRSLFISSSSCGFKTLNANDHSFSILTWPHIHTYPYFNCGEH